MPFRHMPPRVTPPCPARRRHNTISHRFPDYLPARNLGLKESTLANWVKKDKDNEAVAVGEAPLTPAERTRIRELEADVRRLNMENAFLKKASAYFASQNL